MLRTESRPDFCQVMMWGALRGVLGEAFTYPFKVIRYCQQAQGQNSRITACYIFQKKGFSGFYRGLSPELGQTLSKGLWGWPMIIKGPEFLSPYIQNAYYQQIVIGACTALADGIIGTPLEQRKICLATGEPLSKRGWQGCYQNCAHRFVKMTAFLMAYHYLSQKYPKKKSLGEEIKVGIGVTVIVGMISTPLDLHNTLAQAGRSCSHIRLAQYWRGMPMYMLALGINTAMSILLLRMFQKDDIPKQPEESVFGKEAPQNSDAHSRLASRQWSLAPHQNFGEPPC